LGFRLVNVFSGELTVKLSDKVDLDLILIRPGSFVMGSNTGSPEEKPAHKVTITKAFFLGKYEVTQEQWEAVMGSNPSLNKGGKNPVERVSWEDCQIFGKKLNEKFGPSIGTFRLPTEAEWEYACRAGRTTKYFFGDEESRLEEYGNFAPRRVPTTIPVGQKKPNAWGLYDMHGNVWEWCQDWYRNYDGDEVDPTGASEGSYRVLRGGAFSIPRQRCGSGNRFRSKPEIRSGSQGCRLALSPPGY
jgi:formylglycine-generating enzyme required for sulfatase activity